MVGAQNQLLQWQRRDRAEAAQVLGDAESRLAANPTDPRLWLDKGLALMTLGRLDEAEKALAKAIQYKGGDAARLGLGEVHLRRNRLPPARDQFQKVADADGPAAALGYFLSGLATERMGNPARAIKLYAEALRRDPRLRYPDYNPRAVDSRWLDLAMLEVNATSGPASTVPVSILPEPQPVGGSVAAPAEGGEAKAPRPKRTRRPRKDGHDPRLPSPKPAPPPPDDTQAAPPAEAVQPEN